MAAVVDDAHRRLRREARAAAKACGSGGCGTSPSGAAAPLRSTTGWSAADWNAYFEQTAGEGFVRGPGAGTCYLSQADAEAAARAWAASHSTQANVYCDAIYVDRHCNVVYASCGVLWYEDPAKTSGVDCSKGPPDCGSERLLNVQDTTTEEGADSETDCERQVREWYDECGESSTQGGRWNRGPWSEVPYEGFDLDLDQEALAAALGHVDETGTWDLQNHPNPDPSSGFQEDWRYWHEFPDRLNDLSEGGGVPAGSVQDTAEAPTAPPVAQSPPIRRTVVPKSTGNPWQTPPTNYGPAGGVPVPVSGPIEVGDIPDIVEVWCSMQSAVEAYRTLEKSENAAISAASACWTAEQDACQAGSPYQILEGFDSNLAAAYCEKVTEINCADELAAEDAATAAAKRAYDQVPVECRRIVVR